MEELENMEDLVLADSYESNEEEEEEEEKSCCFKLYEKWFDAFLSKHGLDMKHLDSKHSSSVQQLEKLWVKKQVAAAQMRSKEAEIDINLINTRYARSLNLAHILAQTEITLLVLFYFRGGLSMFL